MAETNDRVISLEAYIAEKTAAGVLAPAGVRVGLQNVNNTSYVTTGAPKISLKLNIEKITGAYFAHQKEGKRLESPNTQPGTHKVESGSTLSGIAAQYPGVSYQQIAEANNISPPYTIYPGQELTIPGTTGEAVTTATPKAQPTFKTATTATPKAQPTFNATAPKQSFTHTVESGSTLSEIAEEYGVSEDEIAKANNIIDKNKIQAGQQLIIPGTTGEEIATNEDNESEGVKEGVYYEKITSASIGQEVFLVVESLNLQGKETTITIFEKEPFLVGKGQPLPVLKDDSEITEIKATFHDTGKAVVKIQLRPKSDEDYKKWKDKFKPPEPPPAVSDALAGAPQQQTDPEPFIGYLWLKVEAKGDERTHEEEFLKGEKFFEIRNSDCCKIDEEHFFTEYDKEFSSSKLTSSNKDSLKKLFAGINDYYSSEKRCCNLKHIAYMLATAKHETAHTYNPISEYGGNSYFEGMYDPVLGKNANRRQMAIANGNTTQGDGVKYRGRGFVQLTWKNNYQKMATKFGVDLINNPEKALEHELAVKIMIYGSEEGVFTGKKLSDYINDTSTDYYNARRVINGVDKATTIKNYATKIEKCLKIQDCGC